MPKKAYECSACNEVHNFHHEAERCCQPEVGEVWLCDICEEAHEDKNDATDCCANSVKAKGVDTVRCHNCYRDQELIRHAFEIQVAGHCSECNPHYSIDDKFKIDDLIGQHLEDVAFGLA